MSARTRRSRSSSRTADAVLLTAGDPERLTGGNIYARHMADALVRAGIDVRTVVLRREMRPEDVPAPLAIVDTIAWRFATSGLRPLRATGTRVVLMALMSRGALAMGMTSDRVIASSEALRVELTRSRIDGARVAVVRPGLDPLRPNDPPRDGGRVLCVANWTPEKRVDAVVRAVSHLPELMLDLVGDAPVREYGALVRKLATAPAVKGRVRIWGSLGGAELDERYRSATVFALPSRTESYGMALATALAHGLPSIAGDTPASREVAGDAALFVSFARTELVAALQSIARDAALRERLRRAALDRARSFPTWAESEARFVAIVREELDAATRHLASHMPKG